MQSRAGSLGRGCQSVPETVHPGVQPEFTHSVCKIHVPQSALASRTPAYTKQHRKTLVYHYTHMHKDEIKSINKRRCTHETYRTFKIQSIFSASANWEFGTGEQTVRVSHAVYTCMATHCLHISASKVRPRETYAKPNTQREK